MLMDETYESKTGELCQECLPGILGTLDRENVAEKFLVTAQPWDKNFWVSSATFSMASSNLMCSNTFVLAGGLPMIPENTIASSVSVLAYHMR
jgi:hypothetical protein